MFVKRALVAFIIPTLLAASACSSGTEQQAQSLSGDENTGEVSSAIGENSCAYAGSNAGYSFVGSIADPGFVTDADYTNPKCYKAWIAEIDNWASAHQDLVVADATIDSASWHPPRAPSSGPPLQFPGPNATLVEHAVSFPIGQAECESLSMIAILYDSGRYVNTRTASGKWVPFGGFGYCARPWVRFGNRSQRNTDIDNLQQGHEYKVAATLRSGSATRAVKILTPTTVCGAETGACCPNGADVSNCDSSGDSCQGGTCQPCGIAGKPACTQADGSLTCNAGLRLLNGTCTPCGHGGQPACKQPDGTLACTPVNETLMLDEGQCVPCSGPDQFCCVAAFSNSTVQCEAGLTCQDYYCKPPPPKPNPSYDPACGNQYHQCCPGTACKLAQACVKNGAFLTAGQDDLTQGICDNVGLPNYCVVSATAVIDSCSGGNNILPNTKVQGCGSTLQNAQLSAVLGFGYANICIDNNTDNCCKYHFE